MTWQPKTFGQQCHLGRRKFLMGAVGLFAAPVTLRAEEDELLQTEKTARRNISSFRLHDWNDHFDTLGRGIIISDTKTRVLQHWTGEGELRIYPTSVPLTDELTRRGYTEVVEKRKNPSWAPTPSMRERNPEDLEILRKIAYFHYKVKDYAGAIPLYEELIAKAGDSANALNDHKLIAFCLRKVENFQDAVFRSKIASEKCLQSLEQCSHARIMARRGIRCD